MSVVRIDESRTDDVYRARNIALISLGALSILCIAGPTLTAVLWAYGSPVAHIFGIASTSIILLLSVTLWLLRLPTTAPAAWFACLTSSAVLFYAIAQGTNASTSGMFLVLVVLLAGMCLAPRFIGVVVAIDITGYAIVLANVEHTSGLPDVPTFGLVTTLLLLAGAFVYMASNVREENVAKLRTARADAERTNATKSAYLAAMSHELRTPLTAIIGYTELMLEESEDADFHDFDDELSRVVSSATHLLSLLDDVLDLAKVESGRMTVHAEYVDTGLMLEELEGTASTLAKKKDNTFVLEPPDPPLVLHTDRTKVRQILLNLVSNAAKFTEGGTITLSARGLPEGVMLRVQDTGIGMTSDQLARVFDEYVQAEDDTQSRFGGTGLGLALVQRLVTLLGGTIDVDSEYGQGTTFTVVLPGSPPTQPEAAR